MLNLTLKFTLTLILTLILIQSGFCPGWGVIVRGHRNIQCAPPKLAVT